MNIDKKLDTLESLITEPGCTFQNMYSAIDMMQLDASQLTRAIDILSRRAKFITK